MEKKYEVKDKEDSIKNFFLQYADRISSEVNYELRKKKRDIPDDVFGTLYAIMPDAVLSTMNSWCVFPKFFSKEYHFEVYLSNKEQQNYRMMRKTAANQQGCPSDVSIGFHILQICRTFHSSSCDILSSGIPCISGSFPV